jgi:hypothetical protein
VSRHHITYPTHRSCVGEDQSPDPTP